MKSPQIHPDKPSVLYVSRALTPPWDEASKNFAHNLAKHITNADITVMTNGHVDDLPPRVTQADIYAPAPPSTFSTRQKFQSLWYQWRHRRSFDIAHYFFTPAKVNALFIRTLFKNPRTRTIQTVATLRTDILSRKDFQRILFADRLVTYTKYAARQLDDMGFRNVSHAYPGIDLEHFAPAPKDARITEHFAIPDSAFVVMYPGEYIRLGATDTIIDALTALWESDHPRARDTILLLALRVKNTADAQKKLAIQERIAAAGFANRVRYTDTFSDMRGLYNLADIVLFPVANMHGKFDVPLALIEAYACAKPTIVSSIPRLHEFTNPAISAIIESGDAEALHETLARLIIDTQQRTALATAARAFAQKHFDIKQTAQHYENLYREIRRRD